jgi:hypothetical protein
LCFEQLQQRFEVNGKAKDHDENDTIPAFTGRFQCHAVLPGGLHEGAV